MNSLPPSLWFPLSGERGNWKKEHFLCSGRFHSLAVAFRNTKPHREGETKRPNRQRSKTCLEKHCQNKTSNLTSLALMRLVPGADRVIRHICIRCISPHENTVSFKNDHRHTFFPHHSITRACYFMAKPSMSWSRNLHSFLMNAYFFIPRPVAK